MNIYLDNSATTQPSEQVIERMARAMREGYYNPSSLYGPALASERAMRACRERIAAALSVSGMGNVIFTSGGTESNNLSILGAVAAMHGPQHVALSAVEHPSVGEAFERLRAAGHKVTVIGVDQAGRLDFEALEAALKEPVSLVSCMQVNNETGAIMDIERLSRMVRESASGALIHVDGVQGFMRLPFDARRVDMYTLSAHKIQGPKGVGALWVRRGVRLIARQVGGGQENALRSGTENTPGIAGLCAAVEQYAAMEDLAGDLMRKKLRLARGLLKAVPQALFNGPAPEEGAPHILNVSFPGVRGEVMLHALEAEGVYCSTGSACSSKKRKLSAVLLNMGIAPDRAECALRMSLSPATTQEEIDCACQAAGRVYGQLSRFKRR